MNPAWIVTGIILLGGMMAGGISIYLKRRKETRTDLFENAEIRPDLSEPEKDKNNFP
jgi:LPXTG-motif cell wall-anchored protein